MKKHGIVGLLAAFSLVATPARAANLDISEMVDGVRQALDQIERTAPKDSKLQVNEVEIEIAAVVKTEGGGGFKIYVVTVDGKYSSEQIQRFKYKLGPAPGKRLRAEKDVPWAWGFWDPDPGLEYYAWFRNPSGPIMGFDAKEKTLFILDGKAGRVIPVQLTDETRLWDPEGKSIPVTAVSAGKTATVVDELDPKTGAWKPSLVVIQPKQPVFVPPYPAPR